MFNVNISIVLFLLLVFVQLNAQQQIIDSLDIQLKEGPPIITKIDILNELAFQSIYINTKNARKYANQALKLARTNKYTKGEASAYVSLGTIEKSNGAYTQAIKHYERALHLRDSIKDFKGVAGTYNNIALVYKKQGDYEKAIEHYNLSLPYITKRQQSRTAASIYNNLGNAHMRNGNFEEAIVNIDQSILIRENIGDEIGKAQCFLNLGNLYEKLDLSDNALINFDKALVIFRSKGIKNGEAKCILNMGALQLKLREHSKAIEHFELVANLKQYLNPEDQALVNLNLGSLFIQKGQYSIALPYIQESLDTFIVLRQNEKIAQCHYHLGNIFYNNSQYNNALIHFQNSLDISSEIVDLFFKCQLLYKLSETHAQLNNFDQAFQFSQSLAELQDSSNINDKKAMNLLLKMEENEKVLYKLKSEKERKDLIIKALIGLFLLLFVTAIAGFYAYRNRKRQQLAEKNEQIAKQKIDELLKNQELDTSYARLEGQHKERQRIAQDLHDRLGSMLSTVKLYFKAIDSKIVALREDNQMQYQKATELLDNACEEVRNVAHNLESGALSEFGLKEELLSLANSIELTNQLKVNVYTHGLTERLDEFLEIKIYRILQELVNNAIKHSKAKTLSIQINRFKEIINILVEDDGVGFDPLLAKNKGGMGLKNVESRVNELEGTVQIDSGKGNGTSISIDIPV